MSWRLEVNTRTVGEYLAGRYGVEESLDAEAEQVLQEARSTAPVLTGAYRDSLHIETDRAGDRMVKRVIADVEYAMVVEADTGNLARALG